MRGRRRRSARGWFNYADAASFAGESDPSSPADEVDTAADDPLLLYFTSGTTSQPKLVEHSQVSYPVGHLSTMYWIGLQPGDVHLNVSSPGWAKHSWSNVFAPWNAGATVFIYNYTRFDAQDLLQALATYGVTTFCAPPTVWRMLIQADLSSVQVPVRECISAGEPLNPEVIEQVQHAWGITIRDGFGQTETTAVIGNTPASRSNRARWAGRCRGTRSRWSTRPPAGSATTARSAWAGAAAGGADARLPRRPSAHRRVMRDGFYHTGDVASRDDGYITYVGRADDVFKAADYRISPFELESVLIEHPAVAEAAVVPSPDALRLRAECVVLAPGNEPSRELAGEILAYREHLAGTSGSGGSSSPSCRRRSPGRSAGSSCADEADKVEQGESAPHAYDESDFR